MNRFLTAFTIPAVAIFALASCSSTKLVKITVDPPEAVIYLDGAKVGTGSYQKVLDFTDRPSYTFEAKMEKFANVKLDVSFEPETTIDYPIKLKRMYSISVPLIDFAAKKKAAGLDVGLEEFQTFAYYATTEPQGNNQGLSPVTSNEEANLFYGGPVLSPDEDFIVYHLLEKDGDKINSQIRKQEIGAKATAVLVNNEKNAHVLFPVPTAEGCLYSSNRLTGKYALWLKSYRGSMRTKKSTGFTQDFAASMSPTGNVIACSGLNPNGEELKVFTITTNDSKSSEFGAGIDPQISPDGKTILFLKKAPDSENTQIWMMDFAGNEETQVTNNVDYSVKDARWSPDGTMIIFASNEGKDDQGRNNYDIWMMKTDGSEKQQLLTNGSHDDKPCFDRHGEKIYFRSNRGAFWNIWSLKLPKRYSNKREGFNMK